MTTKTSRAKTRSRSAKDLPAKTATDRLRQLLVHLPHRPGVYRFLDREQKALYVGKAKDLAKRVRSYFRPSTLQPATRTNPRLQAMLRQVTDIAYTEVASEVEALILETNFIKELQPKYNILMRDDKSHLYLKITLREDFPRIYRLRNPSRDPQAKIFGPFTSSDPLQTMDRVFRRLFPYRTCHLDIHAVGPGTVEVKPKTRHLPCLLYHIKRCLGPCIGACSKDAYRAMIERVILFLEGKTDQIKQVIQDRMQKTAVSRLFEEAAKWRDQLAALEKLTAKQRMVSQRYQDQDVLGYAVEHEQAAVVMFAVRSGKLVRQNTLFLQAPGIDDQQASGASVMAAFLAQHYTLLPQPAPVIVLAADLPDKTSWTRLLSEPSSAPTNTPKLVYPQRGERKQLVKLANQNAAAALKKWQAERAAGNEPPQQSLAQLAKALGLKSPPQRIECFDVSHTQGQEVVGAMTVFLNGAPAPQHYRRFQMKATADKNDDYAALREILNRRLRNLPASQRDVGVQEDSSFITLPDLMVIDGGKGQLKVAQQVLAELQLAKDIPLCSLAKKEELVFLPGETEGQQLGEGPARHLLQAIRDEAHRFAISYHRRKHRAAALHSKLDDIPGVGPGTRKKLLQKFGSAAAVRQASLEELVTVIGPKLATRLKEQL